MTSMLDEGTAVVRAVRDDPTSRGRAVTVVALVLILAQVAFRAWALWGGWFFGDDFVFMADVARGQADLGWFFHRHNVHFMPLSFLMVLPVAHGGVFAWHVAALEMIVVQALASLICWWMLRTIFGNRVRILVPLTFYLFAAISMPALMWWAAALNMMTVQPAIFAAITFHVLYLRTRRKLFVLTSSLALVLGLSVYVKALLIPFVLVVIALAYFAQGTILRRAWSALRDFWLAWVAYAMIGVGYLVIYFSAGGSPTDKGSVDYPALVQQSVVANLGTGVLGGPWNWTPASVENGPRGLSDPPQIVQTVAVAVIVLMLTYVASRYRGALKPLWFLAPYVAISVAILAAGRVATFGAGITMEIRYWTDFLPYLALAIGLMTMPMIGARDPLVPRDPPLVAVALPWRWKAGFAMAFVVGGVYSSYTYVTPWHEDYQARSFLKTASGVLQKSPDRVDLADDGVPEGVLQGIAYPYNDPSRILAQVNSHFRTPDIANNMMVLDGLGLLGAGVASPDVTVPAENLGTCLVGGFIGSTVQLGSRTYDYPFWASMTYRANEAMTVPLTAGESNYDAPFLSGLHTLSFRTVGSYDTMTLDIPPGGRICIDAITIGQRMEQR